MTRWRLGQWNSANNCIAANYKLNENVLCIHWVRYRRMPGTGVEGFDEKSRYKCRLGRCGEVNSASSKLLDTLFQFTIGKHYDTELNEPEHACRKSEREVENEREKYTYNNTLIVRRSNNNKVTPIRVYVWMIFMRCCQLFR